MIRKNWITALILFVFCFGPAVSSYAGVANIEKQCWLTNKDDFQISDVDLVVRTINTHQPAPDYPVRLLGIARRFKKEWPYHIGVIGMQEVPGKMTGCMTMGGKVDGSECLASALGNKAASAYSIPNKVGIVAGYPWEITGSDYWNVGSWFEKRYIIETRLKHSVKGWKLRFYTTHLSSQRRHREDRLKQAREVIRIIRKRAMPGELPPIIVGDFNAGRYFDGTTPESSVLEMEKIFYRPIDMALKCKAGAPTRTGIDIVYIGKKSVFNKSIGEFVPIRTHNIKFAGIPVKVDGAPGFFDELTDHHSQGFSFHIKDAHISRQSASSLSKSAGKVF